MATPSPNSYVFTPGVTLYAGMATPSGGTTLTTIALANTSATEQASGFVSPMFGLPLKQGDVPAGQYPAFFLADNTPVPATIHSVTSWPDGSMKWCGVFLRVPSTVAGSGTLPITVKNGGSAPGSSARAVSDLSAADLKVELTGVTNLTGTWTASLNDAITNGTVAVIGDGPVGKLVRILGDFKQSSSAHGQLVCWHYALIAQNSSGGLLGIRYLGRVAQPWANVTSPAPAQRQFSAALKYGATTIRAIQGYNASDVLSSTVTMPHYTDFYTCGANGQWDFVQSGGSASADCTIRVIYDKTYFEQTKLVPPYDLTVSPTTSAIVSYAAQCLGSCTVRNMDTTGERQELGVLPAWAVRHLMTQSEADERSVRVSGLASGGWRNVVRLSTTKQVIPSVDIQASYTGMGDAQPWWRLRDGAASIGVNDVPSVFLWRAELDSSHRPAANYYAYLITGEPQYLDMAVEIAATWVLTAAPTGNTWKTGSPISGGTPTSGSWAGERDAIINGVTYKGAGVAIRGSLFRLQAWGTRDIAHATALYPDTCPYGTETKKYLNDVLESAYLALKAYNDALPASWRDGGIVSFYENGGSNTYFESPWALGYWSNAVCHMSNILPEISDLAVFRQHLAKFYASQHAISDIACLAAYRFSQWKQDNTRVESASDLVFMIEDGQGTVTPSTSTNRITVSIFTTITNGDVFMFDTRVSGAAKPCVEAENGRRLYAVNASGNTCQLSLTPGGAVLTLTSNAVINSWFCRVANAAPRFSFQGFGANDAYVANIYGALRHHQACGDLVVSGARLAQDANWAETGSTFVSDPKNAMAVEYPT